MVVALRFSLLLAPVLVSCTHLRATAVSDQRGRLSLDSTRTGDLLDEEELFEKSDDDSVHVVVISDRAQALLGSLGSLMLRTTIPTIVHVITRNDNLEEELAPLLAIPSKAVKIEFIRFESVLEDLKLQGEIPVWEWPEFGRSISHPKEWMWKPTIHVHKWDNLTVHSNPMNLLRFYLPQLTIFQRIESLIFMDDDIIVKGDLAVLQDKKPAPGKVQLATCGLWKWGTPPKGQPGFLHHSSVPLDEVGFMYMGPKDKQTPYYRKSVDAAIHDLNGMNPDLHGQNYWNYGFVKMNLTEWRGANLTLHFGRWMRRNYDAHIFPECSLSYGLGIPILMLMQRVQCWDDVDISISDGLGYISRRAYANSGVDLRTLDSSFVLHWSGTSKPFDPSASNGFSQEWNSVLVELGLPKVGSELSLSSLGLKRRRASLLELGQEFLDEGIRKSGRTSVSLLSTTTDDMAAEVRGDTKLKVFDGFGDGEP